MAFQDELIKSLKMHGERVAIEKDGQSLFFKDLLRLSNQITAFLLKEGMGPETLVGIPLTDRSRLICSIIGVLNAGCTFVPINAGLPSRRLASMIDDLGLRYLIVSKEEGTLYDNIPAGQLQQYFFEDIIQESDLSLKEIDYPVFRDEDSIYIYFTSGSTGRPKGIVGKNESLLQFIQWEIREFGIDHTIRVSQFINPYFDAFLRDIFVPLLTGGTICIPPDEDDFFTAHKMISWIDTAGISLIHCVPSLFRVINNSVITPAAFKSLRYILMSGEKIIPSELVPWYKVFGDRIQLVNLYGATETTMIRSCYRIQPGDAEKNRISIGSPITDTELLILDEHLQPCERYVTGDLFIKSRFATKGYLNAPELTQSKFLKLGTDVNEPVAFRTGDRARMLADGEIELIGREDRQVKLRGMLVDLDEIEYILTRSEWVKNAVVIKHTEDNKTAGLQESLIAFVISTRLSHAAEDLEKILQAHLKEHLPVYMLPSTIIIVDEFPLLSNGKINYKELLNKATVRRIEGPADETEAALLAIWMEILGNKTISTADSFHRIGGNSLSIMRLISKIYNRFSVRISLNELINNLTIRKQAELIRRTTRDSFLVIPNAALAPAYHLSSAQERIYYHYQLDKEGTAFNLPIALEAKLALDVNRLKNAFKALLQRHESLRTRFVFENGSILQVIEDVVDFQIEEINIKASSIDTVIAGFIKAFNLDKGPLIRAAIVIIEGKKQLLLIDVHHIVCDGRSQANILSDLFKLYNGETLGPLKIQYKDYAAWEHGIKMTHEYIAHREFWLRSFDGSIPKLQLPVTEAGGGALSGKGGTVLFRIDRAELLPFINLLKKEEITTFSGLLAVFFVYLSQLTGQEDIVIGINTAGRIQEELEDQVGMFAKTLPVRYRADSTLRFRDFVKNLHGYLLQAYSNQLYDLVDIMNELNRNKPVHIKHLFETMFSFIDAGLHELQAEGTNFTHYPFENQSAKYPLHLFAEEAADGFTCRFEYLSDYFTKEDVELLSAQFQLLFKQIARNPDAPILEYADVNEESLVCEGREIVIKF